MSAHPLQSIGFRCETWPQKLAVVLLHLGSMWNQKLYFLEKCPRLSESEIAARLVKLKPFVAVVRQCFSYWDD